MTEPLRKLTDQEYAVLNIAAQACGHPAYANKRETASLLAMGLLEPAREGEVYRATTLGREVWERGGEP